MKIRNVTCSNPKYKREKGKTFFPCPPKKREEVKERNCSLVKVTIQQNQSRFRFFSSHFGEFIKVNPDYLQLQLCCSFKIPN